MVAIAVPEDVAAHLQAAIQLANRRVQLRLLHEAEAIAEQKLPIAAVIIAVAVLESALEGVSPERYSSHSAAIARWRVERNAAADAGSPEPTLEQATAMVRGIRGFVSEFVPTDSGQPENSAPRTPRELRGKYKHLPTSSAAFMQRKADELGIEH